MARSLLVFALAALLPAAPPVQDEGGWHREYYPDGSLRLEVEIEPGWNDATVRDGKFRRLAPDGVVLVEGRYKDGRPRGKWTFRYANGAELAQGFYDDGVPAREWKLWRPDGELWAKGEVSGAAPAGGWTPPFPPGAWEFRDASGDVDPVHSGTYAVDSAVWPSGRPRHAGLVLDGAPHGPWIGWWDDGSPRERGAYVRGERVGAWTFRHRDGTEDGALIRGGGDAPEWPSVPPIEEGEEGEEGEAAEPPAETPAPAGALPALTERPEDSAPLPLVAALTSSNTIERAEAQRTVAAKGPELVPALIDALAAVDLSDPAQVQRAHGLAGGLAGACGGRGFGWRTAADAAAAEANRATLRRWHSLWSLTADDAVLWRIVFGTPAAPGEELLDFGRVTVPRAAPPAVAAPLAGAEPELQGGVEAALAWLAAHQSADGHWSGAGFDAHCRARGEEPCFGTGQEGHDVGLTALATLAFLRAGHGPSGGPYADGVARAIGWLLRQQLDTGVYGQRWTLEHVYSHCAATWALAEAAGAFGLAERAPGVLASIRRAVAVIEHARNTGESAGWRYGFEPNGDADTSVTGWAVHALLAARAAGVEVDPEALASGLALVDRMTADDGRVGYDSRGSFSARTPASVDLFPHAEAGEPMTAVGVLVRLAVAEALGTQPDEGALKRHAALLAKPPSWDPLAGRDFYWWFWGAQATRALGGSAWQAWRPALVREVLHHQEPHGEARGSWLPESVWGGVGGRVYATALLAMCLVEAAKA